MIFPYSLPPLPLPPFPSLPLPFFLSSLSPFHPERFRNKLQVWQNNGWRVGFICEVNECQGTNEAFEFGKSWPADRL